MLRSVFCSVLGVLGAIYCLSVSGAGLQIGPKCSMDSNEWNYPFQNTSGSYLLNRTQWSLCKEPPNVVTWNVTLFSLLVAASCLELLLCGMQVVNAIIGVFCGESLTAVSSRRPLGSSILICKPHMPLGRGSLQFPKSPQARPGPSSCPPSRRNARCLQPRCPQGSWVPPRERRKPRGGGLGDTTAAPHLRGKGRLAGSAGASYPPPSDPVRGTSQPGATQRRWVGCNNLTSTEVRTGGLPSTPRSKGPTALEETASW